MNLFGEKDQEEVWQEVAGVTGVPQLDSINFMEYGKVTYLLYNNMASRVNLAWVFEQVVNGRKKQRDILGEGLLLLFEKGEIVEWTPMGVPFQINDKVDVETLTNHAKRNDASILVLSPEPKEEPYKLVVDKPVNVWKPLFGYLLFPILIDGKYGLHPQKRVEWMFKFNA